MSFTQDLRKFYYWLFVAAVGFALIALVAVPIWRGLEQSISFDKRDVINAFLTRLTSGDIQGATVLLHPQSKNLLSEQDLAALGEAAPLVDFAYYYADKEGSLTVFKGVAKTQGGCESNFEISMSGILIVGYLLKPLCPAQ